MAVEVGAMGTVRWRVGSAASWVESEVKTRSRIWRQARDHWLAVGSALVLVVVEVLVVSLAEEAPPLPLPLPEVSCGLSVVVAAVMEEEGGGPAESKPVSGCM